MKSELFLLLVIKNNLYKITNETFTEIAACLYKTKHMFSKIRIVQYKGEILFHTIS